MNKAILDTKEVKIGNNIIELELSSRGDYLVSSLVVTDAMEVKHNDLLLAALNMIDSDKELGINAPEPVIKAYVDGDNIVRTYMLLDERYILLLIISLCKDILDDHLDNIFDSMINEVENGGPKEFGSMFRFLSNKEGSENE